ncbi:alpha/beta hydrolase [Clostridia bacterium]|nr:alpha/beta hydrolase [Clostridia bacterium]
MAINKAMQSALKALTHLDWDVKKTYKTQRQIENLSAKIPVLPLDYKIWDKKITCGDHDVPVRVFASGNPVTADRPPHVLVFFHGGGWVLGNIDTYKNTCMAMAKLTNCMVVSVDYRLAPEYRFPAAAEDCYAAAREIFTGGILGTSPENITLIGDSAGGNLAAAVSQMARDRHEFNVPRQILIYPAVNNCHDETSQFPSVKENGTDYLLSSKRVAALLDMYKSSEADLCNPYFAPLVTKNFNNQPKTLIISAEFCPLRDEGEYYGIKLKEAGNDVIIYRMKDAIHGFLSFPPGFSQVKKAYAVIKDFLRDYT